MIMYNHFYSLTFIISPQKLLGWCNFPPLNPLGVLTPRLCTIDRVLVHPSTQAEFLQSSQLRGSNQPANQLDQTEICKRLKKVIETSTEFKLTPGRDQLYSAVQYMFTLSKKFCTAQPTSILPNLGSKGFSMQSVIENVRGNQHKHINSFFYSKNLNINWGGYFDL